MHLDQTAQMGAGGSVGMLATLLIHIDSHLLEALLHNSAAAGLHVLDVLQVERVQVFRKSLHHCLPIRRQLLHSIR